MNIDLGPGKITLPGINAQAPSVSLAGFVMVCHRQAIYFIHSRFVKSDMTKSLIFKSRYDKSFCIIFIQVMSNLFKSGSIHLFSKHLNLSVPTPHPHTHVASPQPVLPATEVNGAGRRLQASHCQDIAILEHRRGAARATKRHGWNTLGIVGATHVVLHGKRCTNLRLRMQPWYLVVGLPAT